MTINLFDNAGSELLIELAGAGGEDELATQFHAALQQEMQHPALVRGWLRDAVLNEAA